MKAILATIIRVIGSSIANPQSAKLWSLGCCRRSWKRKRAGFEVSGCTGSPLRWWGEPAEFAGVFRRNREAGLVASW